MSFIRAITIFFLGLVWESFAMEWMDVTFPPERFSSMRAYDAVFILGTMLVYVLSWASAGACVRFVFRPTK